MIELDHVVYAVRDLDEAAERFRGAYGLDSVAGGRHAGWGTGNRIVPLGAQYVELISVLDPVEAEASSFGRSMRSFLEDGDRPWGIVCRTDDLDAVAGRLDLEITDGSRARPDGRVVAWRAAGFEDPRREPHMPFFIQWDLASEDLYPGRAPVEHAVGVRGISSVVATGDAGRLAEWLGDADLPIRVSDGPAAVTRLTVATDDAEIAIA